MSAEYTFRLINEVNRDLADYLRNGEPRYLRQDLESLQQYVQSLESRSPDLKKARIADAVVDLLRLVSEPEGNKTEKYRRLNRLFRETVVAPLAAHRNFLTTDVPEGPVLPTDVVPVSFETRSVSEPVEISKGEGKALGKIVSFMAREGIPAIEEALAAIRGISDVATAVWAIADLEKSGDPSLRQLGQVARKIIYRCSSVALWTYKARHAVYRITELPQTLQHLPNLDRTQLQRLFKALPTLHDETKIIGQAQTAAVSEKLLRAFGQWSIGYRDTLAKLGEKVPAHLRLRREGQVDEGDMGPLLDMALENLLDLERNMASFVGVLRRVVPTSDASTELGWEKAAMLRSAQIRDRVLPPPAPTTQRLKPLPIQEGTEPVEPAPLAPTKKKFTRMEAIAWAGRHRRQVRITYTKAAHASPEGGVTQDYTVEPYSFRMRRTRRGTIRFFYGFDQADGTIKSFYSRAIKRVTVLNLPFTPRWEVEV